MRGIARTLSTILSQAVEASCFRPIRRYLRSADDPEPEIDPFTREDVALMLSVAREGFPDWYEWLLCGLRTGMRARELLRSGGATSTGGVHASSWPSNVRKAFKRILDAAGLHYRGPLRPRRNRARRKAEWKTA